ncbi:hypothetical protein [Panacagrimonas sp.]|uniref:hypothetical protein n=1 Tax=Panacagrimonas sp. TaxID=2480088 RepID=UPI003B5281D7
MFVEPARLQWTSEGLDARPFKFTEAQRAELKAITPKRPNGRPRQIDDRLIAEIERIVLFEYADSSRYLERAKESESAAALATRVRALAADIQAAPERITTETLAPGEKTHLWGWMLPALLREYAALVDRYVPAAQAKQFGQRGSSTAGPNHKAIGMIRRRAAQRIAEAMHARRGLQATQTHESVLIRVLRVTFAACEPVEWAKSAPLTATRLHNLAGKSSARKHSVGREMTP